MARGWAQTEITGDLPPGGGCYKREELAGLLLTLHLFISIRPQPDGVAWSWTVSPQDCELT